MASILHQRLGSQRQKLQRSLPEDPRRQPQKRNYNGDYNVGALIIGIGFRVTLLDNHNKEPPK